MAEPGRDIAAVDGDLGAADEARFLAREKQRELGAFLRRSLAAEGDRRARGMRESLAAAPKKSGVGDLSGMDRIDADLPRRELQDGRLGQAAQAPFRGRVGGVVMRRQ